MSYKLVLNLINKGKAPNSFLLYGDEEFLINDVVKIIKKAYIDRNFEDMNYNEFDKIEDCFSEFYEYATTFPFLSEKKLCIVKDSTFLTSGGSLNKNDEDKLINLIEQGNDSTIIVFQIKNGKPDSRKKIVKRLKEKNSIFEINKLNESELNKYILDKFNKNKIEISSGDASYIAINTGYLEYESNISLYEVNNEIDKLISYSADIKKINRDDIDLLMIKSIESNIFKLVDYICEGKKTKTNEIIEEMLLNNTPVQFIIHMIIRQYRMLYHYIVLKNKGYSNDEIMNNMKIKKFIFMKLLNQSKNLTVKDIEIYMDKFLELDKKIKIGEIDSRIGLEVITNGIII